MSAATTPRRRKPAEERRREIVDTVLVLAYEHGPDKITAEAIAKRIGLAQPAVFRHFPSMQDLWLAVVDTVRDRVKAQWDVHDDPQAPAEARIRSVLHAHLGVIQTHPGLPSILFSRELQARNKELQKRLTGHMEGFIQRLGGLLEIGVAAGEVRSGLDTDRAARCMVAVLQGTAFRWALSEQSFDLQQQGMAALEVVWAGLRVE